MFHRNYVFVENREGGRKKEIVAARGVTRYQQLSIFFLKPRQ